MTLYRSPSKDHYDICCYASKSGDDGRKMDLKITIAASIKAKREAVGLSQDRLAAKAGISSRYYQAVETAKKQPSLDTIFKIATALDCDYTELLKPVWDYWLSQPDGERE